MNNSHDVAMNLLYGLIADYSASSTDQAFFFDISPSHYAPFLVAGLLLLTLSIAQKSHYSARFLENRCSAKQYFSYGRTLGLDSE